MYSVFWDAVKVYRKSAVAAANVGLLAADQKTPKIYSIHNYSGVLSVLRVVSILRQKKPLREDYLKNKATYVCREGLNYLLWKGLYGKLKVVIKKEYSDD